MLCIDHLRAPALRPFVAAKPAASALRQRFDFRRWAKNANAGRGDKAHDARTPGPATALPMRVYEAKLVYEATLFEVGATALNSAELVYAYMKDTLEVYPTQEVFQVILLNRKNRPLGRNLVTIGTAGSKLVHPREVYRPAILGGASAIICVHNHPSGDPAPSAADIRVTRLLREAAQTVEIDLLDHIVLGHKDADPVGLGFYSFRSAGLL